MPDVLHVTSLTEFDALIQRTVSNTNLLLVVDFTAQWCGPCKRIGPIFEEMALSYPNAVFVKVDVDRASEIASRSEIRSMPTFHFYKGGVLAKQFSGANVNLLRTSVEELMPSSSSTAAASSCQKGCCGGHTTASAHTMKSSPVKLSAPKQLVLKFFEECTVSLNDFRLNKDLAPAMPPMLDGLKAKILAIQMEAVENIVSQYNSEIKDEAISAESLGAALRQVAQTDDKELKDASEIFNSAARMCLARTALLSEQKWRENGSPNLRDFRTKDNFDKVEMRQAFFEFFGLVNAAIHLPEIQAELQEDSSEGERQIDANHLIPSIPEEIDQIPIPLIQKKIILLQNACLNATNFDAGFGIAVLNKLPFNYPGDTELMNYFREFLKVMANVTANLSSKELVDEATGTKVVSVKYSEKNEEETSAPRDSGMGHQMSFEQQKQFAMARKAAELQQTVMGELMEMDEDVRDRVLADAKVVHDNFVAESTKLPSGSERIAYLQRMQAETRRKLVMHNLWQQLVARNGGKPPKIKLAET